MAKKLGATQRNRAKRNSATLADLAGGCDGLDGLALAAKAALHKKRQQCASNHKRAMKATMIKTKEQAIACEQ